MGETECAECDRLQARSHQAFRDFVAAREAQDSFALDIQNLDRESLEKWNWLKAEVERTEEDRDNALSEEAQHRAACRVGKSE